MTHDPNAWDAGLDTLLDAERRNVGAPDAAEARVWGKLAMAIGPGPGGGPGGKGGAEPPAPTPAHAAPALGRAAWFASRAGAAGLYALGVATGIVGSVAVMHAAKTPVAGPVSIVADAVKVDREVAAPAVSVQLSAMADASPAGTTRPASVTPVRSVAPAEHTHGDELMLVDEARTALARGEGATALQATTTHAQRYPHGQFVEEREAIAIQSLLLVQRYDDARQREAAFERQYPHSMFLQAVRASVQSIP